MAFTSAQIRKLKAKLKSQHIKSRDSGGAVLNYLEGWHILAEANRIFGFGGWDRETVTSTCVWTKQIGQRYAAAYVCRVRITVRAGGEVIIREGSGAGESNAASPGQAHEFAAKAAETDSTKRALSTFGNAFGLSLYAGSAALTVNRCSNEPASMPGEQQAQLSQPVFSESSGKPGDAPSHISEDCPPSPMSAGPILVSESATGNGKEALGV